MTKEDEFRALLAMSPYANVKPGTPYPAVLLEHGVNDSRVDVWMALKFASRLAAATTSNNPILLRLDYDAGHGVGADARAGAGADGGSLELPAVARGPSGLPARRGAVIRAAALAALLLVSIGSSAMNIDSYWEYSDPAASEARFRAALPQATADERLELLTQIARTHSLRRQFGASARACSTKSNRNWVARVPRRARATCSSAAAPSTRQATRRARRTCSGRPGRPRAPRASTGSRSTPRTCSRSSSRRPARPRGPSAASNSRAFRPMPRRAGCCRRC